MRNHMTSSNDRAARAVEPSDTNPGRQTVVLTAAPGSRAKKKLERTEFPAGERGDEP